MSEFHVTVVRVKNVQHHPNADRLDTCFALDYPVITRRDPHNGRVVVKMVGEGYLTR